MNVWPSDLPEVLVIETKRHGDDRGYLSETWSQRRFADVGVRFDALQENHSYSAEAGTVRGLHLQAPPHAQAKLVRVVAGKVLDIVVDVRVGSPRFGRWWGVELSASNGRQLLAPVGFLHGFVTLTPNTEVLYKLDAYYEPAAERAVHWADPTLNIAWPVSPEGATVSAKDAEAKPFADFSSPFEYRADW